MNDRAIVVLERAGDDLARARARPVHEERDRIVRLSAFRMSDLVVAIFAGAGVADRRDDRTAHRGTCRRRAPPAFEQASGVAAQVEN